MLRDVHWYQLGVLIPGNIVYEEDLLNAYRSGDKHNTGQKLIICI